MLQFLKSLFSSTKDMFKIGPTKMAIIVRTDIKMGRGKIASQAAHAAVILYRSSLKTNSPYLNLWMMQGQPKIILKVEMNCDSVLHNIYQSAKEQKINVCMVRDAGKTQITSGTVTSVGIGPDAIEKIDKLASRFKLL